jgi:hypothetical protein
MDVAFVVSIEEYILKLFNDYILNRSIPLSMQLKLLSV